MHLLFLRSGVFHLVQTEVQFIHDNFDGWTMDGINGPCLLCRMCVLNLKNKEKVIPIPYTFGLHVLSMGLLQIIRTTILS